MIASEARKTALDALLEWEESDRYAEAILAAHAGHRSPPLSPPDRALAQDLFYGVIRNLPLLDRIIEEFRRGRIKRHAWNLLRLGLHQIFLSGIADHAAVHETVQLARKHEKGLINAILRSALRERERLEAAIPAWPPEERFSHPGFLVQRWTGQLGEKNALALLEWNNRPPPTYARLRHPAGTAPPPESLLAAARDNALGKDFPGFFRLEGPIPSDWRAGGHLYVQDPSTSLSCRLLDPRPGESILDACAAPGGKTVLLADLAEAAGGEAKITATDSSAKRLATLRENLERLRPGGIETRQVDWLDPPSGLPRFDAILLDVPCSNTGTMRRRLDVRWRLRPEDFAEQAATQRNLLEQAARHLAPGGRLVYSTCSLDREENEQVVEAFAADSGFAMVESVASLPWRDHHDGAYAALLRAE